MKVLVVEDDDLVREVAVETLRDAGFDVVEAATGEEALERSQLGLDAVVLDIRLPGGLDGWDVAERLRERRPDLPVVYASGLPPRERRDVPGSRYFCKPYPPTEVIVAICEQVAAVDPPPASG